MIESQGVEVHRVSYLLENTIHQSCRYDVPHGIGIKQNGIYRETNLSKYIDEDIHITPN